MTKLHVHLVFRTKYRRRVMTPKVLASVLAALKISAEDLGCSLPESNDEADLVHLLVSYPTNASINEMRLHTALDAVVPDGMRGISGTLEGGGAGLFWSRSYFACSAGGASPEVLLKCIANQTNE